MLKLLPCFVIENALGGGVTISLNQDPAQLIEADPACNHLDGTRAEIAC